jgi:hypothetical protein
MRLGIQGIYTIILTLRFVENEFQMLLEDFAFHCIDDYLAEELGNSFSYSTKKRNVRVFRLKTI